MSAEEVGKVEREELLQMTVDIVTAYVSNNAIAPTQINELIQATFSSLSDLHTADQDPAEEPLKPAVSIKKSIGDDYIICLEDGKKLKMLKRHLRTTYNLTPEEYRAKWGLPSDYPMVAPNYAKQRSQFAKKIGLGRKAAG
ncbi:MucR family transcriptional regulator [Thalassospira xianhensis]